MANAWGASWGAAWGSSWGTEGVTPTPTPRQEQPAGNPRSRRRRRVVVRDKVYEVAERDMPAFLKALMTTGAAEKVVRKVKKPGRRAEKVEEWKPVVRGPVLAPFQYYEPLRAEMIARADAKTLAAMDRLWAELQDEDDVEALLFL